MKVSKAMGDVDTIKDLAKWLIKWNKVRGIEMSDKEAGLAAEQVFGGGKKEEKEHVHYLNVKKKKKGK